MTSNNQAHYLYLDPNKRPDDFYPIAIALAVLTGRVALYCPTVQFIQDQAFAQQLKPVLGWLMDMRAITPMGSADQLDEFWPDPARGAPESFIEVDPAFHRDWAEEKALSIDPKYVRLPKKDLAPQTIAKAISRLNSQDERQGFIYTIATDAAVCKQPLHLAGTGREVLCSPLLPSSWLRGLAPILTEEIPFVDPANRFTFQLLESPASQVIANIRKHAYEFAKDCTPEMLNQLRKEYANYETDLELSLTSTDSEIAEEVIQKRLNLENEQRRLAQMQKNYQRFSELISPIKNAAGVLKNSSSPMSSAEQLVATGVSSGLHAVELFYWIRYRRAIGKNRWLYRLFGLA